MKNEEIIEILKGKLEYYNSSLAEYYDEELINALEEANKKINENTKLKAENEQLKARIYANEVKADFNTYCELRECNNRLTVENGMLKADNEKLCEENAELRKEVIKKQLF